LDVSGYPCPETVLKIKSKMKSSPTRLNQQSLPVMGLMRQIDSGKSKPDDVVKKIYH